MAAYTTTQSSPGLLDTLRNTWGSRGNAKPALGLDLDRSFEELQRPKKGFLRSVVASFCLAPAVHGERTNPKLTDGLTDDEEDNDSEATTEVAPPLSLRYTGLGQPWNVKREEAFRARLDKCRRNGAVLVLLRYHPASSHRAQNRKKDHLPPSLLETIRLDASRRAPTAASRETAAGTASPTGTPRTSSRAGPTWA